MSDATIMQGELLSLLRGKVPKTRMWQKEMYFGTGPGPASANKWVNNNACEALFSLIRGDRARAAMIVAHMGNWIKDNGFMTSEWTTPEEVYRELPLNGHATLAGIALEMGSPHFDAIQCEARGNVLHMAKAVMPVSGKRVTDHHLKETDKNVILIGDGKPASPNRYVVQVGHRGWIRARGKKVVPIFYFCDRTGLSQVLALAVGLNPKRSSGASEFDFFHALRNRFPHLHVYGFDLATQAVVRNLMADVTNPAPAIALVALLAEQRCGPRQKVTRYVDTTAALQLFSSINSSTEAVAFDMCYPDGRTVKGSAGTGAREGSGADNVKPLRGWEDATHWYWQDADGGDAVQSWPKPNVAIAYTIDDDPAKPFIEVRDGAGKLLNGPNMAPPIVYPRTLTQPRRTWWQRLFD